MVAARLLKVIACASKIWISRWTLKGACELSWTGYTEPGTGLKMKLERLPQDVTLLSIVKISLCSFERNGCGGQTDTSGPANTCLRFFFFYERMVVEQVIRTFIVREPITDFFDNLFPSGLTSREHDQPL